MRSYDDPKALPPLNYWLKCITAVKSQAPQQRAKKSTENVISKEEAEEVQAMMRGFCEKIGVNKSTGNAYHNKTTLIRNYGILQNLNKGLRQVKTIDGKDWEWVNEWEIGDRKPVDHGKTLELFNSGRISEKEAKKAWEDQ